MTEQEWLQLKKDLVCAQEADHLPHCSICLDVAERAIAEAERCRRFEEVMRSMLGGPIGRVLGVDDCECMTDAFKVVARQSIGIDYWVVGPGPKGAGHKGVTHVG